MKALAIAILSLATFTCAAQQENPRTLKYVNITSASYYRSLPTDSAYQGASVSTTNGVAGKKGVTVGFTTGLSMLSRNPYGNRKWFSLPFQGHIGYFPKGKMKPCLEINYGYHALIPSKDIPRISYGRVIHGWHCVDTGAGVKAKINKTSSFVMMLGYRLQGYLRTGYTTTTNSNYHLGFAQVKCAVMFN